MSGKLSSADRLHVRHRANNRCEYCRIHQDDSYLSFQIDHIISQKHGGTNDLSNLALAIASILCNSIVRFHFKILHYALYFVAGTCTAIRAERSI
jgi:hypothetical protein